MFCQNCGKEIEDGSLFCGYCGASQEAPSTETADDSETVPSNDHVPLFPHAKNVDLPPEARINEIPELPVNMQLTELDEIFITDPTAT